jgi:hypothetical protein
VGKYTSMTEEEQLAEIAKRAKSFQGKSGDELAALDEELSEQKRDISIDQNAIHFVQEFRKQLELMSGPARKVVELTLAGNVGLAGEAEVKKG